MIKYESLYKIKDIKMPSRLYIKVMFAGDTYYSNSNVSVINISPKDYIENGIKSTGYLNKDIINYCADMLNIIKNEVFFDVSKKDEEVFADRYIDSLNSNIVDKYLNFHDLILNDNVMCILSSSVACFNILEVDSDIEFFNSKTIRDIESFLLLFNCDYKDRAYVKFKNNSYKISENDFNTVFTFEELAHMFFKIFLYFSFQQVRDDYTASAIFFINAAKNRIINVESYDRKINNYIGIRPISLNSDCYSYNLLGPNFFKLSSFSSKISENKLHKPMRLLNETFNTFDYILSRKSDINNKILFTRTRSNNDEVFSYNIYHSYLNKNNRIEVVSMNIKAFYKKDYDIGKTLNRIESFNLNYKMFLRTQEKAKCNIPYSDVYYDKSCNDLFNEKSLSYQLELCYYTDKGNPATYNHVDLVHKKIQNPRRDKFYQIFCQLAYELNLDPIKLKDCINAEFLKNYKIPMLIGD